MSYGRKFKKIKYGIARDRIAERRDSNDADSGAVVPKCLCFIAGGCSLCKDHFEVDGIFLKCVDMQWGYSNSQANFTRNKPYVGMAVSNIRMGNHYYESVGNVVHGIRLHLAGVIYPSIYCLVGCYWSPMRISIVYDRQPDVSVGLPALIDMYRDRDATGTYLGSSCFGGVNMDWCNRFEIVWSKTLIGQCLDPGGAPDPLNVTGVMETNSKYGYRIEEVIDLENRVTVVRGGIANLPVTGAYYLVLQNDGDINLLQVESNYQFIGCARYWFLDSKR